MHPLRRRSGSADRRAAVEHDPADDAARVRSFTDDITAACIDLIDLPLDITTQRRVVELLLHAAPEAEQAITRLNNTAVPH
ncbi:hypothetical protein [Mycolicibacterium sphagni]|uniref:Uncharacterized protein n=1 Tax=Mycolicibacterium sphagni TaxID=1786 RepID=A0ABX2JWH8_9MYCO|nr:hypothetical protein [Mycolicibacterium sphagni]NTY62093.1 hypothetical protein [Mycolicibacterium sphagni]